MADEVKVNPTPIQRNLFDVATDLTKLFYEDKSPSSVDEIAETYLKFYITAKAAYNNHFDKSKYLLQEK